MNNRERIAELESQQRVQFLVGVAFLGIVTWALGSKLGRVEEQVYDRASSESLNRLAEIIYHPAVRSHLEDVCSEWAKNNPEDAKRWRAREWGY